MAQRLPKFNAHNVSPHAKFLHRETLDVSKMSEFFENISLLSKRQLKIVKQPQSGLLNSPVFSLDVTKKKMQGKRSVPHLPIQQRWILNQKEKVDQFNLTDLIMNRFNIH
jgi:hypothetical protein